MTLVLRQAKWRFLFAYTPTTYVWLYWVESSFKTYEEKSLFSYYSRELTVMLLILELVLELSNNGAVWTFGGCCFTYLFDKGYQVYRISDSYVKWSYTADTENPSALLSRVPTSRPLPALAGAPRAGQDLSGLRLDVTEEWHRKSYDQRVLRGSWRTDCRSTCFTENKRPFDKQFMDQNCN